MSEISTIQKVQEYQYSFHHHYVPQYKKGFSTAVFSGFGINHVSTLEFLFDKLDEIPFLSLCDVGSGDGRLVKEISERYPDKRVCGIDYSERAINLAKGFNPSLLFIKADIINDNIKDKFDILTLIEVFEHIPLDQAEQFVIALKDLLNDNGKLLLTVPHSNKRVSKKHYQHFTSQSLKAYFEPHFSVEDEIHFEKPKHWGLFFIRRLLKNKLFILNSKRLLNWIYRVYKKKCFLLRRIKEGECI